MRLHQASRRRLEFTEDSTFQAWTDEALCATGGYDPDLWFPRSTKHKIHVRGVPCVPCQAKAICRACPVRRECLDAVMAAERAKIDRQGIFAGLDPSERQALADGKLRLGVAS